MGIRPTLSPSPIAMGEGLGVRVRGARSSSPPRTRQPRKAPPGRLSYSPGPRRGGRLFDGERPEHLVRVHVALVVEASGARRGEGEANRLSAVDDVTACARRQVLPVLLVEEVDVVLRLPL